MANAGEQGAEMTFCVGGKLAQCHRNDTSAADDSAHTTAVQLVHIAAAVVAYVFMFWTVDGIHYSPKWVSSPINNRTNVTICQYDLVRVF